MKYLIIGLGNYGSVLAEELTLLGHEVIGVDNSTTRVDKIKDKITTSFILDATDEQAMTILPLKAMDIVIVAIGEDFAASIKVVSMLKKFGIKHIYARSVNDVHRMVLEAFNLDSILSPEKEAARNLVRILDLHKNAESFKVDKEFYVVKLKAPASFIGFTVDETSIEKEFDLKVISLIKSEVITNKIGIQTIKKSVDEDYTTEQKISENDYLLCYGKYKSFLALWKTIE